MVRLSVLDRKLLRDLRGIRGQAIAIAAVIAAGVALFVLARSNYDSLELTRQIYYRDYRFGDVFASLTRAPERIGDAIARIPGVAQVQTRVVVDVTLDVPGVEQPASGRLVSIPEDRRPLLNNLFLRSGRWIEPGHLDEVLVIESFATAHGLHPGDTVAAVINGRRRELDIVGIALSPEFVYSIRPGQIFPDDRLFGVFWMGREALGNAFDMKGAFNSVVLSTMRGTPKQEVIDRLDRLLDPYGGLGAVPRSQQISNWYLQSEMQGLRASAAIIPVIFLGVAAFLLNVVLSRIIAVQREQIAALKALGRSNATVGWHYVKSGLIIAAAGSLVGLAVGAWMGSGLTRMYTEFFHFPILAYRLDPAVVAISVLVSLSAAVVGALRAVRQAVALPPAEAMRPEPPSSYSESLAERAGLRRLLSQPTRIILRNLQRHPWRAVLAIVGLAFGGAMLIVGSFTIDSIDVLMNVQFNLVQRYDAMIAFNEPASARAADEVERLPGVTYAEPFRAVAARLRAGPRSHNGAITGLPEPSRLNRILDQRTLATVAVPPEGLLLSRKLAQILGVGPGDEVTVEVLEGRRPHRRVAVAGLVKEYIGTNAYMDIDALHRLMDEGGTLSGAYLSVDSAAVDRLYRTIKHTPAISGVLLKQAAIDSFDATMAESIGMMRTVTIFFAAVIAFGVVYNSARIALSERSRELATLRVIGFRKSEIATILLGENLLLTLVSVPAGWGLGYVMAAGTAAAYDFEVYRLPLIILPRTYALAALTVLFSMVASAVLVRRKLARLDLIAVLKTRE